MMTFETLEEVAQELGNGGPFNADVRFRNVEELVDALVNLARTDKIHGRHDDYLGLKEDLSPELLASSIEGASNPAFEAGVRLILEQANIIIQMAQESEDQEDDA